MLEKLANHRFPEDLTNTIDLIYRETKVKGTNNGEISEVTKGVI